MIIRPSRLSAVQRTTLTSIMTGVLGQAALFASGVLVARLLGVEDRGYLALFALVPLVIVQLGGLGLPLAATYYIARDRQHARSIVRSLKWPALIQCGVLALVQASVLWVVLAGESSLIRWAALVTLANGPALLAQQYGRAILQGQGHFRPFNALRLLPTVLYALAVFTVAIFDVGGLLMIAVVWTVSNALAGTVTLAISVRSLPAGASGGSPPSVAQMLRFGLAGFLGSVSPTETFRLDQAIVALFLSPAALGLYVVGQSFTNLPRFTAQSTGMVAYPHIAAQGDRRAGRRSMWQFFWFTAAISGLITGTIAAAAGWLVPLFFGPEFAGAVGVTRILLVGAFFLSARRVLADAARGIGHPALGTAAEIASWVVLIPAFAVLAPRWGIEGIAAALAFASMVSFLVVCTPLAATQADRRPLPTSGQVARTSEEAPIA